MFVLFQRYIFSKLNYIHWKYIQYTKINLLTWLLHSFSLLCLMALSFQFRRKIPASLYLHLRHWYNFYKSKFARINKWTLRGTTPNRKTGKQNNRVINPKTSNANLQIQNDVLASTKNKRCKTITPLHYSM